MPSVSRAQQAAMHAAAAGNSTIGIPQSVGAEFSAADHERGPTKLPERAPKKKSDFHTAMQHHGVTKGGGDHKRHPASGHYKGDTVDRASYRRLK
jgi:hypothetical protein